MEVERKLDNVHVSNRSQYEPPSLNLGPGGCWSGHPCAKQLVHLLPNTRWKDLLKESRCVD
jgi:hypothetical protein